MFVVKTWTYQNSNYELLSTYELDEKTRRKKQDCQVRSQYHGRNEDALVDVTCTAAHLGYVLKNNLPSCFGCGNLNDFFSDTVGERILIFVARK